MTIVEILSRIESEHVSYVPPALRARELTDSDVEMLRLVTRNERERILIMLGLSIPAIDQMLVEAIGYGWSVGQLEEKRAEDAVEALVVAARAALREDGPEWHRVVARLEDRLSEMKRLSSRRRGARRAAALRKQSQRYRSSFVERQQQLAAQTETRVRQVTPHAEYPAAAHESASRSGVN